MRSAPLLGLQSTEPQRRGRYSAARPVQARESQYETPLPPRRSQACGLTCAGPALSPRSVSHRSPLQPRSSRRAVCGTQHRSNPATGTRRPAHTGSQPLRRTPVALRGHHQCPSRAVRAARQRVAAAHSAAVRWHATAVACQQPTLAPPAAALCLAVWRSPPRACGCFAAAHSICGRCRRESPPSSCHRSLAAAGHTCPPPLPALFLPSSLLPRCRFLLPRVLCREAAALC